MVPREQRSKLAAVVRELDMLDTSRTDPLGALLPEVRAVLDLESIALYSLREDTDGWQIDRWHVHEIPSSALRAAMSALLARRDACGVVSYDAAAPAPEQRNRLVEATSLLAASRPGGWLESPFCREVLAPIGYAHHMQHRLLLCDGASLLAWFGTLHRGALHQVQRYLLRAIARPLRRRLRTERLLAGTPRTHAALCTALTHLGQPAFVIDTRGRVLAANPAARAVLTSRDASHALRDALAGGPSSAMFELTELRERGVPVQWLAVARRSPDARIAASIARAAAGWRLTRRQVDVLELVVRGAANVTIAAELAMSTRAIELHVTALLDRIGVDNRAALVAAVLLR